MRVQGQSMEPWLRSGDVVFVREDGPSPVLHRGELVAVRSDMLGGTAIVKRVAGVPCEQVTVGAQTWRLEADDYFILGDNAAESLDSRALGPIKRHEIFGRVRLLMPLRDFVALSWFRGVKEVLKAIAEQGGSS